MVIRTQKLASKNEFLPWLPPVLFAFVIIHADRFRCHENPAQGTPGRKNPETPRWKAIRLALRIPIGNWRISLRSRSSG
jgi:hypothetical protein